LALGTTPRPLAAHRLLGETAREGKYSARHTGWSKLYSGITPLAIPETYDAAGRQSVAEGRC